MKYKISFILIAAILIFALSGCSNGIKEDEAKTHVDSFFEAVELEDYDAAEELLHPDRPATLIDFFSALEMGLNVDFQAGMEIVEYISKSSVLYDSTVGGSTYSLEMEVLVGESAFNIDIEIVRNDKGYGIYNFNFTPVQ